MEYAIILVLFGFVCAMYPNVIIASSYTNDYCWKDLDDKIPLHAIVAGFDSDGRSLYIGQTIFQKNLIPGIVFANSKTVDIESASFVYSSDQYVKVLASNHPFNFQWIKTNDSDVPRLKNEKTLIVGGFEPRFTTYIGKVEKHGVTLVGKIICEQFSCIGLYVGNKGVREVYGEYQILAYNPLP